MFTGSAARRNGSQRSYIWAIALCLAALGALALAIRSSSVERRTTAHLERHPDYAPLSPASELKTFALADPRLRITLAASEPMVEAPIACSFDEDGRLWVVEMRTYMPDLTGSGELEPDNRIVILEDLDNDGVFDKSTTFLDRLVLPRAVAPCHGGALVIEPPNLFFCPDRNKDGVADDKIRLLDGFLGRENPEHAGNGLVYGIDNWWHLSQHHEEFSFNGERITSRRPTPVVGQWGLARDDVGRLYYTPNSDALLCDVFPKHYASRNPHYTNPAGIGENICRDQRVWPSVSTPGVNRGYMEGVLRADKRLAKLTGACGTVIYRAAALGEEYRGNAFICEVAGNLVKRLILEERDEVPSARNAYEGREFLTSSDERFRPVNLTVAPDGSLIVCDMYRGVVQHKMFVTPYLADQVKRRGLERPLNRGRLWRISNIDQPRSLAPRLSRAGDGELVALLAHEDGWWRDTAQRLLVERGSVAVEEDLLALATNSNADHRARLAALWTLDGLGRKLSSERITLDQATDPNSLLRIHAARISEASPQSQSVGRFLERSVRSRMARVQFVLTEGSNASENAPDSFLQAIRPWLGDRYIRAAALSRAGIKYADSLRFVILHGAWPANERERAFTVELTEIGLRAGAKERSELVSFMAEALVSHPQAGERMLQALRRTLRLDSDEPRAVSLSAEPTSLLSLSVQSHDAGSEQSKHAPMLSKNILDSLRDCVVYLDWPGRPPVSRPKKLKPLNAAQQALFDKGKTLYNACSGCHQESGQGGPGLAESLVGSPIVHGDPVRLATILLIGMEGTYKVGEEEFDGAMPAAYLASDEEYAAVLTYIRREWGNTGDPVSVDSIIKARNSVKGMSQPWKREEFLKGLKQP